MNASPPAGRMVPIVVIGDDLEKIGAAFTPREVELIVKGITLGLSMRDTAKDERSLRCQVRAVFEPRMTGKAVDGG